MPTALPIVFMEIYLMIRRPDLRIPDAMIFDMDGTLFDTEKLGIECWTETFQTLGIQMPQEAVLKTVGCDASEKFRIFLAHAPSSAPSTVSPDVVTKTWKTLFQARLQSRGVPVKAGVRTLLRLLQGLGIPTAVATSSPRALATLLLQASGLQQAFDAVITCEDAPSPKPAPDLYLEAARRLNIEPSSAWAVEDSIQGLRSATAAGIPVLHIPDLQPIEASQLEFAWRRFESLEDVAQHLRLLTGQLFPARNVALSA